MADIAIGRADLPFVLEGAATLSVDTGEMPPDRPLPAVAGVVFEVDTRASARRPVVLGVPGSWTVTLKPKTAVRVTAIRRADTTLVRKYALGPYFAAAADGLVLLLTIGARADDRVAGTFRYAPLSARLPLDASRDVSLAYARACAPDTPLNVLLPEFFAHVRLPSMIRRAPEPGELARVEFGGYLEFGVDVGMRYAVTGTPSLDLARLRLAERCTVGATGSVSFDARLGGFFSIEIRSATDAHGQPRPGWARAIVRRTRTSALTFAADAAVTPRAAPRRLPGTPPELLGALAGVNVGNWLNLLRHIDRLTDWHELTAELDDLAFDFLNAWFGDTVTERTLRALLAKVRATVVECDRIDATVLTIAADLFGAIAEPSAASAAARALETLADLPSWDAMPRTVAPAVWAMLNQLTEGDPLGWVTSRPVDDLRVRAAAVLDTVRTARTTELGAVLRLVRTEFGVTALVNRLRALDTPARLQAALHDRTGAFLQRVLGPGIRALAATRPGDVLARLHRVLAAIDRFEQQVADALTGALTQSLSLRLHAEYARTSDEEALIDLSIDTATADGQALLQAAARGNFTGALAGWRRGLVRVNRGRLTHDLVRKSTLAINLVGWHDGWRYQSIEQLLLHADQQIVPDEGGVTIFSTIDLTKKTDRDHRRVRARTRERVQTNFLLRFLGETHGVIPPDPAGPGYLVDTMTRMRARYQLRLDDTRATRADLAYCLRLAADLGIGDPNLSLAALEAVLPHQAPDDYGPISAHYDVRYTDEGLSRLFTRPPDEPTMRRIMRQTVLAGYLARGAAVADEGWVYWTSAAYRRWAAAPADFAGLSALTWHPIDASPFPERPAPAAVTLSVGRQRALGALYAIEDDFVAGFLTLARLIATRTRLSPVAFERALGRIGIALRQLDDFAESINATFALFDALLMRAGARRASSLTLKSLVEGQEVTKVFLARGQ